jgi:catechol 2,3-dioxygenase-like lactoylglutathione lyase family enzyme
MEIDGTITFFYYDDLETATKFYEEVMGFEKVIDIPLAARAYLWMKTMLFRDPEGYLLEVMQWLKKPYGS